MGVNKVELSNGETLLDLTGDTVTPESLKKGFTAHDKTGALITGEFENKIPDGYIDTSDATADEYDIYYGTTAYVNGKLITGKYWYHGAADQYNANSANCSSTQLRTHSDYEPKALMIVLNSGTYTNNTVIAVWAFKDAIVYHSKTSSGVTRSQVTSNVSNYWYYDAANQQVVISNPTSSYKWSTYNYRVFTFR